MSRVRLIAIPTARRPAELQRAVMSYRAAADAHAGNVPVVVFHTARSAAEAKEVSDIAMASGAARYVGLPEKLALAKTLARRTGVPPALLEFALFHRASTPVPTGANRNSALLWSAGQGMLSADDDTTADLFAHPKLAGEMHLDTALIHGDASDYFVPSNGDVAQFRVVAGDARWPSGGVLGAVESAWAATASAGITAPIAYFGLAGDCGWGAPFGVWGVPLGYLQLPTSSLARFTTSRERWHEVLRTRRMLRAAPELRIAQQAPCMSTALAIDGSLMLPPFLPVGRGQDLLFGVMVERVHGHPSLWLPYGIAHEPASDRAFHDGEYLRTAGALDLCGVMSALLHDCPSQAGLAGIGTHLRRVAALDDETFAEALMMSRRVQLGAALDGMRARAAVEPLPAFWRDDVERYCDRAARALAESTSPWVLDIGANDARASLAQARTIVERYGALCDAWPAIWRESCAIAAEREDDATVAVRSTPTPVPVIPAAAASLCSPYQTWLWRAYLLDPADTGPLTFRAYEGTGVIDTTRLEQALRALGSRHEMLRASFRASEDGDARLQTHPVAEIALRQLGPLSSAERDVARNRERTTPILLETAVPWRITIVRTELPDVWELWLTFHHIAVDGYAEGILWRELGQIDANLAAGRDALADLPPLPDIFRGIAARQRARIAERDIQAAEAHWRRTLADAPPELPVSYRDGAGSRSRDSRRVKRALPTALVDALRALCRRDQTTLAAVLLAAWQAVLAAWSGERDVVLAVDHANRWDDADAATIGLFMSPYPVRTQFADDVPWRVRVQESHARLADAFEWGWLPFERLVNALGPGRRRFELLHAIFTHLRRVALPQLSGGPLTPLESADETAGYPIGLTVEESATDIALILIGSKALFDADDLTRIATGIELALLAMARDLDASPAAITWLSGDDVTRVAAWNATTTSCVHPGPITTWLAATAMRRGDAIAVEAASGQMTFRVLWARAEELASELRALGVQRDERVGVFLDRSPDVLVAMLAVLLAGGGYVPLDPAFPADRLRFMVEDATVRVLITSRSRATALPFDPHATVVCVDDPRAAATPAPAAWIPPTAESLAYILFTSGSTGLPKGVEIPHGALVNFLESMQREPGLVETDVLLALTTFSFDIAGLEIWLPLVTGARIALGGQEEAADGEKLAAALLRHQVTVLQATPSTWRGLLATGWEGNATLTALVGGEALPLDLARALAAKCATAWNMYGPTETTIWSAVWRIPRGTNIVRVGRPIANTRVHVLDDRQRAVPIGVTGELFIAGAGVARGYFNRAELTTQRFGPEPEHADSRMYATGDLARWLPDGVVELLGRNDDQLKLRGYRIESGEVEAAILRLDFVERAAVTMHRPPSGDARLVAFVVLKRGATLPRNDEIRALLRAWLLDHMLPYHMVAVDALPLTPNGKVDRRRLAATFTRNVGDGSVDDDATALSRASEIERAVLEQMRDLLGRPIGLDTDFFDAGGDSIGALRLVARLATVREGVVSTGDLFLHSTARRLAARFSAHAPGRAAVTHLVTMQHGAAACPVVFVHAIGGHLAPYVRLAKYLDTDTPLFGLEGVRSSGWQYASIVERAAAYAREIVQAVNGRVALAGYSLGGVLAIEIASQLKRAGVAVELVALLDTSVPYRATVGWQRVTFRAQQLWRFSWTDRWLWAEDQWSRRVGRKVDDSPDLAEGRPLIDVAQMAELRRQAIEWQPPRTDVPVRLYRAMRHVRGYAAPDGSLGWELFCTNLTVMNVACDHSQMVNEPYVMALATDLSGKLLAASASTPG